MNRPIPYRGDQSYIFISYAHRDSELVWPIVDRMQKDGYRVWYDEGIDPGTEWDENIAAHVNGCDFFIAFLSRNYLASDNCKDELNFARDQGKQRILIYLEEVALPQGMAMRLGRNQAIYYDRYQDKEVFYGKLYEAQGIDAFGPGGSVATGMHLPTQPVAVQHKSAGKKPGLPRWVIPGVVLAVVAVIAVAALTLLGGEKPPAAGEGTSSDTSALPEQTVWEEQVLVDNDVLRVVVTDPDVSDDSAYLMDVTIENKTQRPLYLYVEDCYVDCAACEMDWYGEVEGGQKVAGRMEISREELDRYNITQVTGVTGVLKCSYDDDNTPVGSYTFAVYPYGEENAASAPWEQTDGQVVLFESEDYTVVVDNSYIDDSRGEWVLELYWINRSERAVYMSLKDTVLNGYLADEVGYLMLEPGTIAWSKGYITLSPDLGETMVLLEGEVQIEDAVNYNVMATEHFTYYPAGEAPTGLLMRERQDTDLVLLENEYVELLLTGVVSEGDARYVWFYIRNKTDGLLYLDCENVLVNGAEEFMFMSNMPAGSQRASYEYWNCADGGELQELQFTFVATDEDWNTLFSQEIRITFENEA